MSAKKRIRPPLIEHNRKRHKKYRSGLGGVNAAQSVMDTIMMLLEGISAVDRVNILIEFCFVCGEKYCKHTVARRKGIDPTISSKEGQ